MKKALSLLLSVLMLLGMVAVPAYADENDGFNDGSFDWDVVEPDVPPVAPEEPIEGTEDNPIYVAMGLMAPTSLSLKAGESIYYQLKPQVLNGYSVLVYNEYVSIVVDGVEAGAYSHIDYAVKATLEFTPMSAGIVCITNTGEEDWVEDPITVEWRMPVGTETDPLQLEEGENAISVPANFNVYYTSYVPYSVGDYVLSASNYEDFDITVDVDGDLETTADQFKLKGETTISVDGDHTYMPFFIMVQPYGVTPDITLTVTPPAKGTEGNPYQIYSYEELLAGMDGEGNWTATQDGYYYQVDGYIFDGATLKVTGQAPLTVVVNGQTWSKEGTGEVTLEIPLDLGDALSFAVKISSSADIQMDASFPEGTALNPQDLNWGNNTLHLPEDGITVYASYTAIRDGVLVIKPASTKNLGYTDATNQNTGDYDYIFTGYLNDEGEIEGASEDFVLTIPVSAGDVVLVTACAGENEDFEILAMDLVLNVIYEGDVEIVTQPKTTYGKEGATVKVPLTAKGEGLTYTWYIKNAGSSKYSKSSITTNTYSVKISDASHGRYVYCIVKDKYGNEVKSNTVLIRRQASIITEPTTGYAKLGAKVSVKVTAKGDGLTYTWYFRNASASKYSKSSVTSATYSTTMSSAAKGRYVYCIVKDKYGKTVQTKTVVLRESVSITKESATAAYAKKGAKASVKVTASGDGLTYTWYVKNANASKYTKSSVKTATYSTSISSTTKGRRVYCIVKDKYGKTVQSKTFLLRESVSITTQPKTVTVKKNATAKVTVKASGDGLTYTWYYKNAGAKKFTKVSGSKNYYSAKMTSSVKNRQVYCVVKDKYGKTVQTKTVTLKMK